MGAILNTNHKTNSSKYLSSWCFQPIWKVWVKSEIFPKYIGVKKKNMPETTTMLAWCTYLWPNRKKRKTQSPRFWGMHQGQNVVFWLLVVLGLPDSWRKDITHTLSNITLVHWVVFTKSKHKKDTIENDTLRLIFQPINFSGCPTSYTIQVHEYAKHKTVLSEPCNLHGSIIFFGILLQPFLTIGEAMKRPTCYISKMDQNGGTCRDGKSISSTCLFANHTIS